MMISFRHNSFALRLVHLVGLAFFLMPGQAAEAQDESAESMQQSLQAAREKLAGIESAAQRLTQLQSILSQRRLLIEAHPNDPDRAIWLADQASDLFFDVLGIEAAGLTVLYGHPSQSQLAGAQRVAREMHDFATRAEVQIDETILQLESQSGYGGDIALQQQRRRLVENEREGRIPFFRGIGACLQAQINEKNPSARRELFILAARLLIPLADRLQGDLAARARLYGALALGRAERFEESQQQLLLVVDDPQALPVDVFAARMCMVNNRVRRQGSEAGLALLDETAASFRGDSDLFYRVLIADRRFLLRRRLAEMDDAFSLADAYRSYFQLLENPGTASESQLMAIIFARLANAADEKTPLEDLPPIVQVARASHLASTATGLPEAISLIEKALDSGKLSPRERAIALFELGKAHHAYGQSLDAVVRLTQLAREYLTHRHAEQAIELAVAIADRLHREDPGNPDVRRGLREALAVLLASYPNLASIDRWRYSAGRLAISEKRYQEALNYFQQISPGSERWIDGLFMQVSAVRARARDSLTETQHDQLQREVIEIALNSRSRIESAIVEIADEQRLVAIGTYLAFLRVYEAEANLNLKHYQAALDGLEGMESVPGIDGTALAEALKVRISAFQQAGRSEEAQLEIARFIEAAPDQVLRVIGPMLGAMQRDVVTLESEGRDREARDLAERTLLPAARTLDDWRRRNPLVKDARGLLSRIADAYLLGGRHREALKIYDELLSESSSALQFLFGRAECLMGLGGENLAEAMKIYRRLGAAGRGTTKVSANYYWSSQLRMLEILDIAGRNTEKIVPRIRQLRQIDPQLGGERFRRKFERLQNRHS